MRQTFVFIGLFLLSGTSYAAKTNAPPAAAIIPEKPVVTHHAIKAGGTTLNYTATAGFLPLRDEAGKLQANIFFVAYTKDGVSDVSARPITFAFNGGPGASSVWLHLGGLGPKRVVLAGDGTELPKTCRLADNDQTWLGFTDLVFVDPIGTGYSRAVEGVDAKQFYTPTKDIKVASQFIRLYVTKYERWLSPKFVAGESYGTTRAAGLANRLQSATGMNLNGVMLLSSALSFQNFSYDDGNDIAFALALPSFAAAATYHKKVNADIAKVERWTLSDYLEALVRGDTLPEAERERIAEQMAKFTGLSTNYIETSRLRVSASRFVKELLRPEQRTVGLMDSRVIGVDVTPRGEYAHFDPAFFLVTGPFVATVNDYLRRDLNFETDLPYDFLSQEVNGAWKWFEHGQGYVYVADDLAEAMARDRFFRVFAAAGEYDLTTPYLGQEYTFDHMGLDPSLRSNLVFRTYPAGHQIYTDTASRKKLYDDVAAFVSGAFAQPSANDSMHKPETIP
jgi:carboxypeptidase C (cathepsin A)